MTLQLKADQQIAILQLLGRSPIDDLDADVVWDLVRKGALRLVVTNGGLSAVAEDGLVLVDDARHVQDCEVVRLAARGSRRRGECTCGASRR